MGTRLSATFRGSTSKCSEVLDAGNSFINTSTGLTMYEQEPLSHAAHRTIQKSILVHILVYWKGRRCLLALLPACPPSYSLPSIIVPLLLSKSLLSSQKQKAVKWDSKLGWAISSNHRSDFWACCLFQDHLLTSCKVRPFVPIISTASILRPPLSLVWSGHQHPSWNPVW